MENLLTGITGLFTDPMAMLFFFAALIGGLFFAALPGINMVTLGAIILPFTAKRHGDQVWGHDIGKVVAKIKAGDHVHIHNLKTKRW